MKLWGAFFLFEEKPATHFAEELLLYANQSLGQKLELNMFVLSFCGL